MNFCKRLVCLTAFLALAACGDDEPKKAKVSPSNSANSANSVNNANSANSVNNANSTNSINNANSTNSINNANSANSANNALLCGNGALDPGEACDSGISTGTGSCPNSCVDAGNSCRVGTVTGNAASCSAQCVFAEITACIGNDGCCPMGCTSASDSDCSPTCGNGTLDANETCDGNCPTTCNDNQACTSDRLIGSAANCNAQCSYESISVCQSGDGCCPSTCNATNDNDCAARCGNGIVEGNETCDGNCPTSCADTNMCTADAISGTPGQCNVVCSNTAISACQSGDGCCPQNCSYPTDMDCTCTPAVCGGAGRQCGNPSNGCGGTLSCGSCPTGFACDSSFTCVPVSQTAVPVGAACTSDNNCAPAAGGYCGLNPDFKDGYCSKQCQYDNDCPGGSHCGNKDTQTGLGECLANCTSTGDCRSGYACRNWDNDSAPTNECAPTGDGNGGIGAACVGLWQCDGGNQASCLKDSSGWTNGYCTEPCNGFLPTCPSGSYCDAAFIFDGQCLDECSSNANCRSGYTCNAVNDTGGSLITRVCEPI